MSNLCRRCSTWNVFEFDMEPIRSTNVKTEAVKKSDNPAF